MERFSQAAELGIVQQSHRFRFIALWMNTLSKAAAGRIKNAAAVFVKNLERGLSGDEWYGTDTEDDAAREFLREYDRREDHFTSEAQADALLGDGIEQSELEVPEHD